MWASLITVLLLAVSSRAARVGQCSCNTVGEMVVIWDHRASLPPKRACEKCGWERPQLLIDCARYQVPLEPPRPCDPVKGLMEFYMLTAQPDVAHPSWARP